MNSLDRMYEEHINTRKNKLKTMVSRGWQVIKSFFYGCCHWHIILVDDRKKEKHVNAYPLMMVNKIRVLSIPMKVTIAVWDCQGELDECVSVMSDMVDAYNEKWNRENKVGG